MGYRSIEEIYNAGLSIDETKKAIADYFPESRFFINAEKWIQLSKNHK